MRLVRAAGIDSTNIQLSGSGARVQIVSTAAVNNSSIAAAGEALLMSAPQVSASTISAASALSLSLGNVTGSTLGISGAVGVIAATSVNGSVLSLGRAGIIHIATALANTSLTTAGNLNGLIAATFSGDTIAVGAVATPISSATAATLGTASLGSVRAISRAAGAFADTTILAHTIGVAVLGQVVTSNAGAADGVAAVAIRAASLSADGTAHRLNARLLAQPAVFGDFEIELL
jgi:hypothetical protein